MSDKSAYNATTHMGIQSKQPPDPSRFPAAYAGWFLKRERLSYGLALNKVAAQLKIRERYLWAIEEGVDAEFPQASNFFSIVGAYAEYLHFDPDPLIEHYYKIMPAMEEAQKRGPGNIIALWPVMRARGGPYALASVAILVAIVSAGLWLTTGSSPSGDNAKLIARTGSPEKKKIATIPASESLTILKRRDAIEGLAKVRQDEPVTTSSIPSSDEKVTGQGSIRVRKIDLSKALKVDPKTLVPLDRNALAAQLEAAAARDKNKPSSK